MKIEINRGLTFIIAMFLLMFGAGCSNTKYILHSKLPSQASSQIIKLGSDSYPVPNEYGYMYGTLFNTSELAGWIDIKNKMLFDTSTSQFSRYPEGSFTIYVGMHYLDTPKLIKISGVSGKLTLNNGQVVLPFEIQYGLNSNVCIQSNLNGAETITPNDTVEILPSYKSVCLGFSYSEFVSAQNKFTFYLGEVEESNNSAKLDFNFIPVIVKTSTH